MPLLALLDEVAGLGGVLVALGACYPVLVMPVSLPQGYLYDTPMHTPTDRVHVCRKE